MFNRADETSRAQLTAIPDCLLQEERQPVLGGAFRQWPLVMGAYRPDEDSFRELLG